MDILSRRLTNQRLAGNTLASPAEVVQWLGAAQAQDFHGAKWSLAQRMTDATDATLNAAFDAGTILRTHVLRPTWHFVAPGDIRWMLALTAPRVHALNAYYYRQNKLDAGVFARSHDTLVRTLEGGRQATRTELQAALQRAGIVQEGDPPLRFIYLLMEAELEGLLCSGALRGKQHTYALLDERVPRTRTWDRDEALAELTKRYFQSHGPATIKDFAWWSGLTMADAQAGLDMARAQIGHEVIEDPNATMPVAPTTGETPPRVYLHSLYDESIISYADRTAMSLRVHAAHADTEVFTRLTWMLVVDGQIVGTFKRTIGARNLTIDASPLVLLSQGEWLALEAAAARYGRFLALPVTVQRA